MSRKRALLMLGLLALAGCQTAARRPAPPDLIGTATPDGFSADVRLVTTDVRNFARLAGRPIALWDERRSTAAVERALISADMSRARRAEVVDQHAAAFILEGALGFLDRLVENQEETDREG